MEIGMRQVLDFEFCLPRSLKCRDIFKIQRSLKFLLWIVFAHDMDQYNRKW
jgi:hypothetical protein